MFYSVGFVIVVSVFVAFCPMVSYSLVVLAELLLFENAREK